MTTLSDLSLFSDTLYAKFVMAFPDYKWTILPEIDGNSCQMGFIIITTKMANGKEEHVVSRPRVPMSNEELFHTPEFEESILAVFEQPLFGSNTRFHCHPRFQAQIAESH